MNLRIVSLLKNSDTKKLNFTPTLCRKVNLENLKSNPLENALQSVCLVCLIILLSQSLSIQFHFIVFVIFVFHAFGIVLFFCYAWPGFVLH